MNIHSNREQWTKFIKEKFPTQYYSAYAKKPTENIAGNFELLEKIKYLEKEIRELKTQNLNVMTRVINLEVRFTDDVKK